MKKFHLLDTSGKSIGFIELEEKIIDSITTFRPDIKLGYSWNSAKPKDILDFSFVLEPAAEKRNG